MTTDGRTDHVYTAAIGMAEAMVKEGTAVRELLRLADDSRDVLEGARERADEAARDAARRPTDATQEVAPEAPAQLASRLLEQALEELDRRTGRGSEREA